MNILISGGTGFIGSQLSKLLLKKGWKVIIFTREKTKVSSEMRAVSDLQEIREDEEIDGIVNLSGSSISQRWTKKYKKILQDSRIVSTQKLMGLIARLKEKPKVLLNASSIGYYGSQNDNVLTENSQGKEGFTNKLCVQWEQEALAAEKLGLRVCIVRFGIVLGKNGGALHKMLGIFRIGLGGTIGSGSQYYSWVHQDDVSEALYFLLSNQEQNGVFNLTAPYPVTNKEFTLELSRQLKRPHFCSLPSFAVKMIFGEMGEVLLLNGQRVIPQKLQHVGFNFQYSTIKEALENLLKR